jgi:hypothetical protein
MSSEISGSPSSWPCTPSVHSSRRSRGPKSTNSVSTCTVSERPSAFVTPETGAASLTVMPSPSVARAGRDASV